MVRAVPSLVSALGLCAAAASPALAANCTGVNAINPACASKEVPYLRDFFYVGGRSLATSSGTLTVDQLYVERLTPPGGPTQRRPLVFFHGGGTSGVTWLNTPDNRQGWASYFVSKGFAVYLVDSASVGRSSENDLASFSPMGAGTTAEGLEKSFTDPQAAGYYPQSALHTQWPGTGTAGDPTFEQFRAAMIPLTYSFAAQEAANRASGCELLRLLGGEPAYLVSHSLGAYTPYLMTNDCPSLVAGNINLEAANTPFWAYDFGLGGFDSNPWGLSYTKVDYDPPVADPSDLPTEFVGNETLAHRNCRLLKEPAPRLPKVASVPYLMVTTEASVHVTYDHCTVEFIRQVGGDPDWIRLADLGIHGNGHFMFLEKNSAQVADVVYDWIKKKDAAGCKKRRVRRSSNFSK